MLGRRPANPSPTAVPPGDRRPWQLSGDPSAATTGIPRRRGSLGFTFQRSHPQLLGLLRLRTIPVLSSST